MRQTMISDKGGGGVGQFLTDKGGRGFLTPPFLADIMCEQPLPFIIYDSMALNICIIIFLMSPLGIP